MLLNQSTLSETWVFFPEFIDKVILARNSFLINVPWWMNTDYWNILNQVRDTYFALPKKFSNLLVLWIWWSALWTSSTFDFLWKWKNIIVLDNLDPEYCENVLSNIDWDNTLVNAISKSWSTLETLSQVSYVKKILESKNLSLRDHFVITTWSKWILREFAIKNNILILDVPESVWWRFSVFTQVSLFPLFFAWVKIENFIYWMIEAINDFKNNTFEKNIPLKLTIAQYYFYEIKKKNISVLFTYNVKLLKLIEWYKQLLSESIWKNNFIGITPMSALWSTDQHSQLQLFLDWPHDKFFTFINSDLAEWPITWDDFEYLKSKSFWEIQKSFFEWTKKSFEHYNIWYQEISLKSDEKDIATFFTNQMLSIWLLWEIFWVNVYDQKAVEYWKIKSKEILSWK